MIHSKRLWQWLGAIFLLSFAVLGLIALLGFMAIAAGVTPIGEDGNTIVPVLFQEKDDPQLFTKVPGTLAAATTKAAHKARIGYIDEAQLKSVLRKDQLGDTERQVLDEVRRLQQDDRTSRGGNRTA